MRSLQHPRHQFRSLMSLNERATSAFNLIRTCRRPLLRIRPGFAGDPKRSSACTPPLPVTNDKTIAPGAKPRPILAGRIMPFEQKVVVITGALRGIGASLVERFRKIGYGVVANSRSIDAAGDPAVLVVDG